MKKYKLIKFPDTIICKNKECKSFFTNYKCDITNVDVKCDNTNYVCYESRDNINFNKTNTKQTGKLCEYKKHNNVLFTCTTPSNKPWCKNTHKHEYYCYSTFYINFNDMNSLIKILLQNENEIDAYFIIKTNYEDKCPNTEFYDKLLKHGYNIAKPNQNECALGINLYEFLEEEYALFDIIVLTQCNNLVDTIFGNNHNITNIDLNPQLDKEIKKRVKRIYNSLNKNGYIMVYYYDDVYHFCKLVNFEDFHTNSDMYDNHIDIHNVICEYMKSYFDKVDNGLYIKKNKKIE